jgi:hypothetical protein
MMIMPGVGNFSYLVKQLHGIEAAQFREVALARELVETSSIAIALNRTPSPMRICVFGAGAVGSHFAVRLALAGHVRCPA